jgi:hypothetical protein
MPPRSVLFMRLALLAHGSDPLAQVHKDFHSPFVILVVCVCVAVFSKCTYAWHWLSDIVYSTLFTGWKL